MNLRQLRYFLKVVETGSMTRAAAELHLAQPALGMQIKQLEDDLGVVLLTRHSRGVDATPAGRLLQEHAIAILGMVEKARREIVAKGGNEAETIRLGLTPALMLLLGAEIAVNARERVPGVHLSLSEAMSHVLVDALLREEIDLAMGYDVPERAQLEREALLVEDLVLVTLPIADDRREIPFAEAMEQRLILPEQGDSVRDQVVRNAELHGLSPRIAYEIRSVPAMKSLILRGAAACILPYAAVLSELREGRLMARRVIDPPLRRTLYLAARARRPFLRSEPGVRAVVRDSLGVLRHELGALVQELPGD